MNIIRIIWLAAKNIQPVDILFEFYSTNSKDTEEIITKATILEIFRVIRVANFDSFATESAVASLFAELIINLTFPGSSPTSNSVTFPKS